MQWLRSVAGKTPRATDANPDAAPSDSKNNGAPVSTAAPSSPSAPTPSQISSSPSTQTSASSSSGSPSSKAVMQTSNGTAPTTRTQTSSSTPTSTSSNSPGSTPSKPATQIPTSTASPTSTQTSSAGPPKQWPVKRDAPINSKSATTPVPEKLGPSTPAEVCASLAKTGFAVCRLPPENAAIVAKAMDCVMRSLRAHRAKWFEMKEPPKPVVPQGCPPARVTSDYLRTQLRWQGGIIPPELDLVDEETIGAMEAAWPLLETLAMSLLETDAAALSNAEKPRSQVGQSSENIVDVFLYSQRGQGPTTSTPMEAHVDRGMVTLVMANKEGLEVTTSTGAWQKVKLEPNEIAVMVGASWSDSRVEPAFKPCTHRVTIPSTQWKTSEDDRCSFTFEVRPSVEGWAAVRDALKQRTAKQLEQEKKAGEYVEYELPWIVKPALLSAGLHPDLIRFVLQYVLPSRPTHQMLAQYETSGQNFVDDVCPLVIDAGAANVRAGFAGDPVRTIFPCCVGRPRHAGVMVGMGKKDAYVGDEAQSKRGILTLKCPIEQGVVSNWDDMEKIWHHTFYNELRCAPEEHPVIITEPPLNPKPCREKVTQIMFETFNVPQLYLVSQPVMALYSTLRTSGVVVDMGSQLTRITPVFEGMIIPAAMQRMFGGNEITEFLSKMFPEFSESMTTYTQRLIIDKVKTEFCYVAADFDHEIGEDKQCSISQADKKAGLIPASEEGEQNSILVSARTRFTAPELLFQPRKLKKFMESEGLHQVIYNSIMKCDPETHKVLFENILLTGGGSLFPGLVQRLESEIKALAPSMKVSVVPESYHDKKHAFMGAALMAHGGLFQINIDEYNEVGPTIVHTKCV